MRKIMHKIKKSSCIVCVIVLVLCTCTNVKAHGDEGDDLSGGETFYINSLGLRLSESEYNELLLYTNEYVIDLMSEEEYSYIKNDIDTCFESSEVKYVKSTYNESDNEILQEEYMTENEMLESINNKNVSTYALSDRTDTVITEMKRIVMQMVNVNASSKTVQLTCEWISIPKVKSYDIIAFRFTDTAVTIDTYFTSNIIGKQYYDDSEITYNYDSNNIKYLDNGLGVSMNIVDSTKKSLACTFKTRFLTPTKTDETDTEVRPFFVYGSYQHAVANVTLSESQDYTLHYWGLGHVIYFDNEMVKKYDETPGLEVFGSINDE